MFVWVVFLWGCKSGWEVRRGEEFQAWGRVLYAVNMTDASQLLPVRVTCFQQTLIPDPLKDWKTLLSLTLELEFDNFTPHWLSFYWQMAKINLLFFYHRRKKVIQGFCGLGGLMHLSPPERCNPAFRRRCVSSCPQTCFPYTCRSLRSWYGPRSPTSHYPTSDLWGQNTQTRCIKFTSDNWGSGQMLCLASADSWQLIVWSLAVGASGQWARRTGRPPPCSAFIIKEHD